LKSNETQFDPCDLIESSSIICFVLVPTTKNKGKKGVNCLVRWTIMAWSFENGNPLLGSPEDGLKMFLKQGARESVNIKKV
jgi:hypothetical protein